MAAKVQKTIVEKLLDQKKIPHNSYEYGDGSGEFMDGMEVADAIGKPYEQVFKTLVDAGIHPLIAIKTCGLWTDSEKVYLQSKPYLDVLYKTIDMVVADAKEQEEKAKAIVEQMNNNKGVTTEQ